VRRSLSGRAWRWRPADAGLVRDHQLRHDLSEPLARALAARGVDAEGAADYLTPTLKAQFPDPSTFADMDLAASDPGRCRRDGRPTAVFADYDVDGASSAAQLVRWFRAMGRELAIYVPDRIIEGYGPSPAAFRHLQEQGADLVVTVDCGAAAHDALIAARDIGLDIVVIDHHLMRGEQPPAAALVNPNRPDDTSGQGHLAAAGVTFVLLAALNREARRRGLFQDRPEPDIRQWLDLAAMGAVCDVTSLTGFNRAIASQGLRVMSAWANPGLKALLEVAKGQGPATTFHAGFILGPRINAGGRIGRSDLGARLLSTDDPQEARDLAEQLDALNASRKDVEKGVIDEAVLAIERDSNFDPTPRPSSSPATAGIRASSASPPPACASAIASRWWSSASTGRRTPARAPDGRSRASILGARCRRPSTRACCWPGAGHAMAAGLTIRPSAIPELRAFLCARLADEMVEAAGLDAIEIDALVSPSGATRGLYTEFQRLAPFGPGNPEPTFAVADARIERPMMLKGGHVRCTLIDSSGGKLKAVAWRAGETAMGERIMAGGGAMHFVGRLKPDDWQGRASVELEIEDAADPRMVL
jgi:single-stranded-DNA-specific exonuclease